MKRNRKMEWASFKAHALTRGYQMQLRRSRELLINAFEVGRPHVALSGGKDSTAMLLLMLERGEQVDDIVFFDWGMEFPEMYEHLDNLEAYIGRPITRLYPRETWDYLFQTTSFCPVLLPCIRLYLKQSQAYRKP